MVAGTEDAENRVGGLRTSPVVGGSEAEDTVCALRRGRGTGLATGGLGSPDGNLSRSSSSPGETLRLLKRKRRSRPPSGESGSGMDIPWSCDNGASGIGGALPTCCSSSFSRCLSSSFSLLRLSSGAWLGVGLGEGLGAGVSMLVRPECELVESDLD